MADAPKAKAPGLLSRSSVHNPKLPAGRYISSTERRRHSSRMGPLLATPPGTLSRLGTLREMCRAAENHSPISLQARHGGQREKPSSGGPGVLLRQ